MKKINRIFPPILSILMIVASFSANSSNNVVKNQLTPFTADGCSLFPDGYPILNPTKWQKCCVIHDRAYWKGGTDVERNIADFNLRQCVKSTGAPFVSDLMYMGVQAGGYRGAPTSYNWGYGWVVARGDKALSESEIKQVIELSQYIPQDLEEVEIASPAVFPKRRTLTKDHCLDLAAKHLLDNFDLPFVVEKFLRPRAKESSRGWEREIKIKTKNCAEPFVFQFLLLHPKACTDLGMNELVARGRIRLRNWKYPKNCQE